LVEAIRRLNKKSSKLRITKEEDVISVCSQMNLEEEGYLTYDEFLILLFKVTRLNEAD
jgi:hypothetical protein